MPTATHASLLSRTAYRRLLADLRALLDISRARAERAAAKELARAYWQVGQRITRERLTSNAGFHNTVLRDLSHDLEVDERTLQRAVRFHQQYETFPELDLGWTHYRELLKLTDPEERAHYQQQALTQGLTAKQLAMSINNDTYEAGPTRGKGAPKLTRPTNPHYLYRATVERVVDGDTLLLMVDLGFDVHKRQRIRLANINAAPLKTPEGKQAHAHLVRRLATAQSLVISTQQVDIHGRYVAHLFYATRPQRKATVFRSGQYLNQQLLDEGVAHRA